MRMPIGKNIYISIYTTNKVIYTGIDIKNL